MEVIISNTRVLAITIMYFIINIIHVMFFNTWNILNDEIHSYCFDNEKDLEKLKDEDYSKIQRNYDIHSGLLYGKVLIKTTILYYVLYMLFFIYTNSIDVGSVL